MKFIYTKILVISEEISISGQQYQHKHPWMEKNISAINGVPFVIYGFWFGTPMKGNRKKQFETMKANIGIPKLIASIIETGIPS